MFVRAMCRPIYGSRWRIFFWRGYGPKHLEAIAPRVLRNIARSRVVIISARGGTLYGVRHRHACDVNLLVLMTARRRDVDTFAWI